MQYKPAEDMLVVEFLEGEEERDDGRIDSGDINDAEAANALAALVMAVGSGVKTFKKGDTVLVRPWARHGVRHENTVFVERWSVVAAIKP